MDRFPMTEADLIRNEAQSNTRANKDLEARVRTLESLLLLLLRAGDDRSLIAPGSHGARELDDFVREMKRR